MIATQILLFDPNWASGVKYRYTWQTSIKRGIQGNERRTKLKSWPIRSISWESYLNSDYFRNLFQRKLFSNLNQIFGIPVWQKLMTLTSAASIGNSVIYCQTDYKNLFNGCLIVITSDFIIYEYAEIQSFNSTSITLTDTLVNGYAIGSQIYPIIQGRISNTNYVNSNQNTGRFASIDFDFSEAYEENQVFQIPINDFPTYNGYSVFNIEPNWDNRIEIGINKPFEVLRSIGIETTYCYQLESDFTITSGFDFTTEESCYRFETFFNDMAGRFKSFWLPTWSNDIVITGAIQNTDVNLTIENINYSASWLVNDLVGRILFLKSYDGTEIYRKIVSAPNATTITLNSAIGVDIGADELKSIVSCFLLPVRFDQDELEMNYSTNSFAETEIKIISVNDSEMIPT